MSFFKIFKRKRQFASRRIQKRSVKKYSVAREFKRQRTGSIKYAVSATRFKMFKFWRIIATFSLVFAVVIGVIAFMFFSAFFSVQNIDLIRQDFRADMETISKITEPYRDKNIFLISKSEIQNLIKQNFPEIKDVKIEKNLPRKITIKVNTYPVAAKWRFYVKPEENILSEAEKIEEPKKYTVFINQVGNMCNGTTEDEGAFLIEEQDITEKAYKFGENVITKKTLDQINTSRKLLEEIVEITISSAKYYRNAKEIHFIAGNGTAFWIDFATPQEKQIQKMHHVIAETDILDEKIEYFDLRVSERIFWKKSE